LFGTPNAKSRHQSDCREQETRETRPIFGRR